MSGSHRREMSPQEDELMVLAGRHCDGTLSPDDLSRLEDLLVEAPELRSKYLAYMELNASLMWRYRTGEGLPADAADVRPDSSSRPSERRPYSYRNPSWIRLAAAAVILAMFVSVAYWVGPTIDRWVGVNADQTTGQRLTGDSQEIQVAVQPTASSHTNPFVATLLDASSAVWAGDGDAVDVGTRIRAGEIRLESGDAELVFDSGAKLVLSGPAQLTLETSLSASLTSGALVAHMPETATGFRLRTESAEFVDQGTEFGVIVESGGPAEVHVFRGQVDVHGEGSSEVVELVDGEAMRIAHAGDQGERITYSKSRFGGLASRVTAPIHWPIKAGGNGHYYQLILTDHPVSWHQAARDSMSRHHLGMPGHLATVTSAEEDRFIIEKLIGESIPRGIWIGLTDVLRESQFRWVTGEPVGYTNWAASPEQQPDNYREADWHGGEDYGMYTATVGSERSWAWNDLSIDSIHETISAYLVEYEPQVDALTQRTITQPPIEWSTASGGNGHHYQLVLSLEPVNWNVVRERAEQSMFNGQHGHLVTLESPGETAFVVDEVLRVCGISENMIGLTGSNLTGSKAEGLRWINGNPVTDIAVGKPYLPADQVYGLLRWNNNEARWEVQSRAIEVQPGAWFGYIIEYP
ncbi:lectin-like protein [Roseiconus lacunae]|uniref:lectin-like protein n=1 Tax=Roseiconus lacunae TaxID=2605694 RepID=UPI003086ED86|nr:lectin-like protein [Stieleria sp. HD01]